MTFVTGRDRPWVFLYSSEMNHQTKGEQGELWAQILELPMIPMRLKGLEATMELGDSTRVTEQDKMTLP